MRESDLKRTVWDYLKYGTNQGKWYADRLNSGIAYVKRGDKYYAIKLCETGTADFIVIQGIETTNLQWTVYDETMGTTHYHTKMPRIIYLELKGDKGKTSPAQNAFKILIEEQGAEYHLIRSIGELQNILEV